MTLRQIAIRIGLDGKAELTTDLKQVGDTGDGAFEQIGTAADEATARIDRQHQALQNLRDAQARVRSENASGQGSAKDAASAFFPEEMERQAQIAQLKAQQIGQNFQTTLNRAMGIGVAGKSASDSASVFQEVAAAQADLEARAAALRAQLDPLGAAQLKLNTAVAGYDTLLGSGKITQDERTAAVALARKEFDATKKSLEAMAAGEGASATKARELLEGFKHLAEGAATGQFSLRQLTSGVGDLMRAGEGGGITSLLSNPYVLGGAAIVATLAAVVVGISRTEDADQQLTLATEFLGRATGVTKDQLADMAVASAQSANISVAAARDIEVAFAKTGMVSGQMLGDLTALTVKFAHATGASMDDAKGALVRAFADPAHAGEQLLSSLGALDDKTRAYLTTAVQSNDIAGAQRVLLEKLRDAVKDGADQWTWYGNALAWVSRQGSGVLDFLGRGFQKLADVKQLANLQDQLAGALKDNRGGFRNAQIATLQRMIAEIQARVDAANAAAAANAADARATQISLTAGPLIAGATPGYQDLKTLQANLASVNAAGRVNAQGQFVADPAVLAKLSMTAQQAADAQNAYSRAVSSYLDPATKAQKLNELDIAALSAKTPAQRAAVAEQRTALELSGQAVTTGEAQRRIDAAGALARAQGTHALADQNARLRENRDAWIAVADAYLNGAAAGQMAELGAKKLAEQIGQTAITGAKQADQIALQVAAQRSLNDQVAAGTISTSEAAQQMQLQSVLAPLLIAEALAEGKAKETLTAIIAKLTAARANDNAEQTRAKALQIAESGDRNIALLKQELQIANDNDSAREIELSILQAKQQLLQNGISLESVEGKRILDNAAASTELNQQLTLAKNSRGELEGLFDSVGGTFKSFITQGKYDWKDFAQAGLNAAQEIEDEFIKLAALNPLKNLIFGTNLPTLDSVGGLLGSFGSFLGLGSSSGMTNFISAGMHHLGGMAGAANSNRPLPANVVRFAPRLHTGAYLAPDEFPAVLQSGEQVLNRQETRDYRRRQGGVVYAPINITTPNPNAFQASKGQIAASLARAVRDGARRM